MRSLAMKLLAVAAAAAAAGCGGSSTGPPGYVSYHEPSQGWTANVPSGWVAVAIGPEFVRGNPLTDPTRLFLQTYRASTPASALRAAREDGGIRRDRDGGQAARTAHSPGSATAASFRGKPGLAVEAATARDGANAEAAALVARRSELDGLVRTALIPALDSFHSGPAVKPQSVLATPAPEPAYWPTTGWRTASPSSQGMDAAQLRAMVAEIRDAGMPIDSVTIVRDGYVVLDRSFGRFAGGTLGEPYASGRLHELQSGRNR